jgi:formylglycine-generating enzyme required for sulfatase activity
MSGNVWEWTRSLWGEDPSRNSYSYPYKQGDAKREDLDAPNNRLRVLRGGSFGLPEYYLRAALRLRFNPAARYVNFGFRMVSSRFRP